jgi:NUMOD4 motif/HNH endonuclease
MFSPKNNGSRGHEYHCKKCRSVRKGGNEMPLTDVEEAQEEWRRIDSYPNYLVSNYGRVKNIYDYHHKQFTDKDGYLYLSLTNEFAKKNVKVHRLVGVSFIPNPNELPVLDHIDRCKTNNKVSNLRWASHTTNKMNQDARAASGYKGVYWRGRGNKWVGSIKHQGISYHLGSFSDSKDAARAVNEKYKELYGDEAFQNIID